MINVDQAIRLLKDGDIVAIPTETVYGLAASIKNKDALEKVFETKKRPFFDPLIVHVSSASEAKKLTNYWPSYADILVKAFWPGPLTIVVPKNTQIEGIITAGLDRVGIRVPNHPIALKIIQQTGPLAAPSANMFTKTSPTNAQHVEIEFEGKVPVVDGGQCDVGIESTVVGLFEKEIKIYRPGIISKEDIQKVVGSEVYIEHAASPVAPGQIKHHYMPKLPLIITDSKDNLPEKININKCNIWNVEETPELTARLLYSKMRDLDSENDFMIFIIPREKFLMETWSGIKNRLEKAATYNRFIHNEE